MKIEDIIKKLAKRKLRLRNLKALEAPKIIIEREERLLKKTELELQITESQIELEYYIEEHDWLDKKREGTDCPSCKYMYETRDGRKLTEEGLFEGRRCTLHPGKEYTGFCDDFEDYGIESGDVAHKICYSEIRRARSMIEETRKRISELEEELKNLNTK